MIALDVAGSFWTRQYYKHPHARAHTYAHKSRKSVSFLCKNHSFEDNGQLIELWKVFHLERTHRHDSRLCAICTVPAWHVTHSVEQTLCKYVGCLHEWIRILSRWEAYRGKINSTLVKFVSQTFFSKNHNDCLLNFDWPINFCVPQIRSSIS